MHYCHELCNIILLIFVYILSGMIKYHTPLIIFKTKSGFAHFIFFYIFLYSSQLKAQMYTYTRINVCRIVSLHFAVKQLNRKPSARSWQNLSHTLELILMLIKSWAGLLALLKESMELGLREGFTRSLMLRSLAHSKTSFIMNLGSLSCFYHKLLAR